MAAAAEQAEQSDFQYPEFPSVAPIPAVVRKFPSQFVGSHSGTDVLRGAPHNSVRGASHYRMYFVPIDPVHTAALVPVAGWAASAVIAYSGTVAMGRTGILYFERGKQEIGAEEMARIRSRAIEEAKAFVSRMRRK